MLKKTKIISFLLVLCLLLCSCSSLNEITGALEDAQETIANAEAFVNEIASEAEGTADAAQDVFAGLRDNPFDTGDQEEELPAEGNTEAETVPSVSVDGSDLLASIPAFDGETPYTVLNNNIPSFTEDEIRCEAYEYYSPLDELGRVGVCEACVCQETMPPYGDERGDISSVYPTGWEQNKYDTELVNAGFVFNRSHILGWQLTDIDAEPTNLMTGTRYFNVEGMLPFENMVADYVHETNNHVMYRVTPIFEGDNLLAHGVQMEAWSVEDDGEGVCFNVFCYNVQPGIEFDYATGENWLAE